MTPVELLDALLEVTPEPPTTALEPEEILVITGEILAATAPLYAALRQAADDELATAPVAARAERLHHRTLAWQAAATAARAQTFQDLSRVSRSRRHTAY